MTVKLNESFGSQTDETTPSYMSSNHSSLNSQLANAVPSFCTRQIERTGCFLMGRNGVIFPFLWACVYYSVHTNSERRRQFRRMYKKKRSCFVNCVVF